MAVIRASWTLSAGGEPLGTGTSCSDRHVACRTQIATVTGIDLAAALDMLNPWLIKAEMPNKE